MSAVKVGIIGYGYWGPNLTRNFHEILGADLVAIADLNEERLKQSQSKYPDVVTKRDYRELFDLELDAVVVSTPPASHYKITKECLEHGLHVLVEKPITLNSRDGEELIQLAAARGLTLMVGHTFRYNSAILEMRKFIENKALGDVYYIDTARLNLGLFNRDSNVIWDLAPHDISILLYLLDEKPISVSAQGMPCVTPGVYDVAYINLIFPNNVTAYVHVSWLDPCKVRRVTIVGSKKMAVFNDMEMDGKIKIYDKGVQVPAYTNGFGEFHYSYHHGDIVIPNVKYTEPLREECQDFLNSIVKHTQPNSSARSGVDVIKIIEAALRSMTNNCAQEMIQW